MEEKIEIVVEEVLSKEQYQEEVLAKFSDLPDIAKPFAKSAKDSVNKIEKFLYSSATFINTLKSSLPKLTFEAILTNEQSARLKDGTLKIMAKKDGTLMANLINPKTKKIEQTIKLQEVKMTPELNNTLLNLKTQLQLAEIIEQIENVQYAIADVRRGQENDRLALAYSCKQKFLQTMVIKNPKLKQRMLLQTISDAEDSRNLLMLSQKENAIFISNQPKGTINQIINSGKINEVEEKINELRDGLSVTNLTTVIEAAAYNELGEVEAAQRSLEYYDDFINNTFLTVEGLATKLDQLDSSPKNYWSKNLPEIHNAIAKLPSLEKSRIEEDIDDEQ